MINAFETMLTGGHPNSLGNTEKVASVVLADSARMQDLYDCYNSEDEVVRLRVSSAFKRIAKAQPEWMLSYVDQFIQRSETLKQPSFQWSFAQIMSEIDTLLSTEQRQAVIATLKTNLETSDDWIVLNMTMEALTKQVNNDPTIATWLKPHLTKHAKDTRKSVSTRAKKYLKELYE